MKFENGYAIAENGDEEGFLASCKSRKVKPGSERFVLRALVDWRKAGRPTRQEKREASFNAKNVACKAACTAFLAHEAQRAETVTRRDRPLSADASTITAACAVYQKKFGESPDFKVLSGERDGVCTVAIGRHAQHITGTGAYYKAAKAAAALAFLNSQGVDADDY